MKRIVIALLAVLSFMPAWGQDNWQQYFTPVKFMGIPVDGTKENMIKSLEGKGFVYDDIYDQLYGEFNGEHVSVTLKTYKGKVCRVCVIPFDARSENQARHRYNELCYQFENTDRYIKPSDLTDHISGFLEEEYNKIVADKPEFAGVRDQFDEIVNMLRADFSTLRLKCVYEIPESDDISWNLYENEEAYEAFFYQKASFSVFPEDIDQFLEFPIAYSASLLNRMVWMALIKDSGGYKTVIYYDNAENHAQGEDL